MITIKHIPVSASGGCSEEVVDYEVRRWRKEQGKSFQCTTAPSYEVNGKPYCVVHAKVTVFKLALEENGLK